ncbi:eCIS core domain-containing protein [Cupriavidus sp. CP313]
MRHTWRQRPTGNQAQMLARPPHISGSGGPARLDNQFAQRYQPNAGPGRDFTSMLRRLAVLPSRKLDAAGRERLPAAVREPARQATLHTGPEASAMALALGAHAFTAGRHVAFGDRQFQPGSTTGNLLLAHELSHVGQYHGASDLPGHGGVAPADSEPEHEAARVAQGDAPSGTGLSHGGIFRDEDRTSTREDLIGRFRSAVRYGRWEDAAVLLNGFNDTDITMLLGELSPKDRELLRNGAAKAMPGWSKRVTDPIESMAFSDMEQGRIARLKQDYDNAVAKGDWDNAALLLNGFNDADIEARTSQLSPEQLDALTKAADRKMPGWADRVIFPAQASLLNQVPLLFPGTGTPRNPLVNWNAGNLRGLPAEDMVLVNNYPGALKLPRNFPGVDFIEGGTSTPITGSGRQGLPFSGQSASIKGGALIQLKTMQNSLDYYQKPDAMYKELSKGLEKLANFEPGTGRSEKVGNEWFRIEHQGTPQRRVLHIELEVAPTPQQQAQLARLATEAESYGAFGAGNKVEVVVKTPSPQSKAGTYAGWGAGTFNVVMFAAQIIGRQKKMERDLETKGYAPVGPLAYADQPWYVRLGSFLRGDFMERAGDVGPINMPVWRANVRDKANAKKPGETLVVSWQYKDPVDPLGFIQDVDVTYQKQQDGSWEVKSVEDKPEGFTPPSLNTILDPTVTDKGVETHLTCSSTKCA